MESLNFTWWKLFRESGHAINGLMEAHLITSENRSQDETGKPSDEVMVLEDHQFQLGENNSHRETVFTQTFSYPGIFFPFSIKLSKSDSVRGFLNLGVAVYRHLRQCLDVLDVWQTTSFFKVPRGFSKENQGFHRFAKTFLTKSTLETFRVNWTKNGPLGTMRSKKLAINTFSFEVTKAKIWKQWSKTFWVRPASVEAKPHEGIATVRKFFGGGGLSTLLFDAKESN